MNETLNHKVIPTDDEMFDAYKNEYIRKFNGKYPPFEWIDWKSKFQTKQDLLKYCIVNNKQWFEVIDPIEEGQKINYGGDNNA